MHENIYQRRSLLPFTDVCRVYAHTFFTICRTICSFVYVGEKEGARLVGISTYIAALRDEPFLQEAVWIVGETRIKVATYFHLVYLLNNVIDLKMAANRMNVAVKCKTYALIERRDFRQIIIGGKKAAHEHLKTPLGNANNLPLQQGARTLT